MGGCNGFSEQSRNAVGVEASNLLWVEGTQLLSDDKQFHRFLRGLSGGRRARGLSSAPLPPPTQLPGRLAQRSEACQACPRPKRRVLPRPQALRPISKASSYSGQARLLVAVDRVEIREFEVLRAAARRRSSSPPIPLLVLGFAYVLLLAMGLMCRETMSEAHRASATTKWKDRAWRPQEMAIGGRSPRALERMLAEWVEGNRG